VTPYYQDQWATLYHGDCLEVLPELGPVDHVITDPPFSSDIYQRCRTKAGDIGKPNDLTAQIIIKQGGIGCVDELIDPISEHIFCLAQRWALIWSDHETSHRWRDALTSVGMEYIRPGVWVKNDPMPQFTGDRPAMGYEVCTIAHATNNRKPVKKRWNGGGKAAVWRHGLCQGNARPDHPCPKPLPLMAELVGLFTDPGELILDPFMGSGTTLRAAKDLGRRAIGIEINERYCEIAAKRLQQEVLPLWGTPCPQ